MANFDSDTYTAQLAAAAKAGSMIADAALISGKLHFIQVKWTVPAGTAAADTVDLVDIPAGLTVIPGLSNIVSPDEPTNAAIALGFTGATTAICSATLLDGGAGVKHLTSNVGFYTNTTRQTLLATISGAGLTEADVVYFNIACVVAE